ncbi:MAG: outer membrane beta-barrel protein, partial [Bacteroidales bacterium]|nr:outer membrane beta-barrel protein [Bacteroidales bacterium]
HNLIFSGDVAIMDNRQDRYMETGNMKGEQLISKLLSDRTNASDRLSGNLTGTYFRMFGSNNSVFKISGSGGYSKSLEDISINNVAEYQAAPEDELYNQFQDNRTDQMNLSVVASFTQKIGKGLYVVPQVRMGSNRETLDRMQGSLANGMEPVDSISPGFAKDYGWIRPGLNLKWNTEKSQVTVGLLGEFGRMETELNSIPYPMANHFYFTPMVSWDYSKKSGRKVNLVYSSSVNTPTVSQLLPVTNNLNPLALYYGNPALGPEVNHRVMAHWLIFDQFSFTSLMTAFSGGYTTNKINWSTTVTDSLVQISTLTNVDWDYKARANADFSTPIRKLGIKINFDAEE